MDRGFLYMEAQGMTSGMDDKRVSKRKAAPFIKGPK